MGSVAHPPVFTPPRSSLPGQSEAVKFPVTERSQGVPIPTKPAPPPPSPRTPTNSPHVVTRQNPPHLPFRRISLPGPLSMIQTDRNSIVSIGSIEAHAEDGPMSSSPHSAQLRNHRMSAYMGDSPVGGGRRRSRARRESSVKPDDRTRYGQEELKVLAKRQKIIEEFYETEKAYVDGLELIYSHFLTPIISSLDDAEPLLNRSILTSMFSNFIDIWNLHRSFFAALSSLLIVPPTTSSGSTPLLTHSESPSSNHTSHQSLSSPARSPTPHPSPFPAPLSERPQLHNPAPPLSPLLLSHFPYLSLYTPFVTSFPSTISSLNQLTSPPTPSRPNTQYNPRFAEFLKERERDSRCGRLKLRDWLLTIVQRCPRYLMLIRDLIGCTPKAGISEGGDGEGRGKGEAEDLESVLRLVTKITESLNTSLQTHAHTLSLISLQKSCANLPPSLHLVSPGRTLIKRGELVQVESKEKAGEERREVLLFSDCLVWFARGGSGGVIDRVGGVGGVIDRVGLGEWDWDWDWWSSSSGSGSSGSGSGSSAPTSAVHTPSSSKLISGPTTPTRPSLNRSRSRSEAQLASATTARLSLSSPSSPLSNASTSITPSGSVISALTASTPSTPAPRPSKRRSMYGFGTPSTSQSPLSPLSQSHVNPHFRTNAKTKTPDPPLLRRSMVVPATSSSNTTSASTPTSSTSTNSTSTSTEDKDKWIFKGKIDLVNLDIVVGGGTSLEDEDRAIRRFEVMSPEGSFVLYADSQASRDDWTTLIRSSKSQVMLSINMSNPYSTLTSSDSKQHVRRALVALPYEWGDERLVGSLRGKGMKWDYGRADDKGKGKGKGKSVINNDSKGGVGPDELKEATSAKNKDKPKKPAERRRKIDHYVPAIWIPDRKTNCCMRCGKLFGWRRRRHHCRLCGRCVCGGCSGRTFFTTDAHAKDETELAASSKPARACDACYDAVFPVVDSSEGEEGGSKEAFGRGLGVDHSYSNEMSGMPNSAGLQSRIQPNDDHAGDAHTPNPAPMGTIGSLMDLNMGLSFPSWLSIPSMASSQSGVGVGVDGKRGVEGSLALMAIDTSADVDHNGGGVEGSRIVMSRRVSRVGDVGWKGDWDSLQNVMEGGSIIFPPRDLEREKRTRIRLSKSSSSSSSHSKMRSYQAILEGFKARDGITGDGGGDVDEEVDKDNVGMQNVNGEEEGDEDHSYFGTRGDLPDLHDGNENGKRANDADEDAAAGTHARNGDGSADSISGGSEWDTDDVDPRETKIGEQDNIDSSSNAQTPPPKPYSSGLQTAYPYVYAYSPSSSRYSLSSAYSPTSATSASPVSPRRAVHNLQRPQRREDTARRSKRFSLPAIGVHAASVTAHTSGSGSGSGSNAADSPITAGVMQGSDSSVNRLSSPGDPSYTPTRAGGVSKRLSLVMMGRNSRYELISSGVAHPGENLNGSPLGRRGAQSSGDTSAEEDGDDVDGSEELDKETSHDMSYGMSTSPSDLGLGKGLAAAKLSELLERSRSQGKA